MKTTTKTKLAALIGASLLTSAFSSFANEQPTGSELVGQYTAGFHLMNIQTDNERTFTADSNSYMDQGNGFGGEVSYRWLPSTEFRLSYAQFDLQAEYSEFESVEPDGSSLAVDMLFFPTEKNFYVIGGVNNLDIGSSQISGNLGAGYRHYLSNKSAIYFESKANYQFSDRYDELTTQVGFIYFFGGESRSSSTSKPTAIAAAKAIDSDKDGVIDSKDKCPSTPMVDKVNVNGCTIFVDSSTSIQLLVNFDNNQAIIKPEFYAEIEAMANFLKANPSINLEIEGHTSSPGTDAHNKALSVARGNAIVDRLVSVYQIDRSRLSVVGYGEERLLNAANNEAAHQQNRRIIANVSVTKKVAVKR